MPKLYQLLLDDAVFQGCVLKSCHSIFGSPSQVCSSGGVPAVVPMLQLARPTRLPLLYADPTELQFTTRALHVVTLSVRVYVCVCVCARACVYLHPWSLKIRTWQRGQGFVLERISSKEALSSSEGCGGTDDEGEDDTAEDTNDDEH